MDIDLIMLEFAIKNVPICGKKLPNLPLIGTLDLFQLLNHHHSNRDVPGKALQYIQFVTLHIQYKEINQWDIGLLQDLIQSLRLKIDSVRLYLPIIVNMM